MTYTIDIEPTDVSHQLLKNQMPDDNIDLDQLATKQNVVIEELTLSEQRDRIQLERKVERAFYEAGKALMELRDRRLYRSTHKTFEEYCRDRFAHSRQKSNYLIAAASVFDNLTTNGYIHLYKEIKQQQQRSYNKAFQHVM